MPLSWLRHRLRALTTIWLLCQVSSLSALAPRYCCAAHGHLGEADEAGHHGATDTDCHQAATTAETCPMAAANRDACPMHRGAAPAAAVASDPHAAHAAPAAGRPAAATAADDCVLTATCQGPVTALASLIWIPGILDDSPAAPIEHVAPLGLPAAAPSPSFVRPVDLPPPRA